LSKFEPRKSVEKKRDKIERRERRVTTSDKQEDFKFFFALNLDAALKMCKSSSPKPDKVRYDIYKKLLSIPISTEGRDKISSAIDIIPLSFV
jgi:hypothetical protein